MSESGKSGLFSGASLTVSTTPMAEVAMLNLTPELKTGIFSALDIPYRGKHRDLGEGPRRFNRAIGYMAAACALVTAPEDHDPNALESLLNNARDLGAYNDSDQSIVPFSSQGISYASKFGHFLFGAKSVAVAYSMTFSALQGINHKVGDSPVPVTRTIGTGDVEEGALTVDASSQRQLRARWAFPSSDIVLSARMPAISRYDTEDLLTYNFDEANPTDSLGVSISRIDSDRQSHPVSVGDLPIPQPFN